MLPEERDPHKENQAQQKPAINSNASKQMYAMAVKVLINSTTVQVNQFLFLSQTKAIFPWFTWSIVVNGDSNLLLVISNSQFLEKICYITAQDLRRL